MPTAAPDKQKAVERLVRILAAKARDAGADASLREATARQVSACEREVDQLVAALQLTATVQP